VFQLEKQFHQCLNDQNDRLNTAQVQIKEVHTENVQMKKQFDEQIIRCNELQTYNQSLKEQLNQSEKRCQQENQPCTRQLEETNNRLNACIIQLNVRLNSNEIQMKKFEDEHKRLKEQVNLLEKQSLQQHRNLVRPLKDSNDRMNLCFRQFNDRSKKSEEVQIEIKQLKEQSIHHKPHVNNYKADSKSQKVTIVQNDEKHNMKHISGN
jgi:chromosome segregation ATPase